MILPCWGETALVKKRLPSRKFVYFDLKEASLLGVGSFHWTSLLSIRILQHSWYVDIIPLLNLKKSAHSQSPALIFCFWGFWRSSKQRITEERQFFWFARHGLRNFQDISAMNQTWRKKPNLRWVFFDVRNGVFFWWFFSPCQVLSPNFFWVSFVWQGGYNNSKKGEQKHEKKAFPTALTSQHWTQPLVEGLYDLDPTVGWHWVQHLSLTECKKACEARFFFVKIRIHQVPIGFLHFSCKIEVCCTRSLCVVKR